MNADTIEGRLMCACNVAYDIQESGPVQSRDWYVAGAGFVEPPTALVGGRNKVDAALVCRSVDGVVLAFRGTLPGPKPESPRRILDDWLQTADIRMAAFTGVGGAVHEGFLKALDSIWSEVYSLVTAMLATLPSPRLLITGHSKGGAMAHLAAARFSQSGAVASSDLAAYVFGTPRLGNTAFASAYRQLVPMAYRFECRDEIAPYLPPSDDVHRQLRQAKLGGHHRPRKDYELVGELRFVDWDDKIRSDSSELEAERLRRFKNKLRHLELHEIIEDHNIECESHYMCAIWHSRVCPPGKSTAT